MQLQSLGFRPFAILFLLLAIGPLLAAAVIHRQAGTFNHIALWIISLISSITYLALTIAILNRGIAVDDSSIFIKSTFYSTTISFAEVTEVRIVQEKSKDDVVGMRVNGIGIPGFSSGWFSSREGGRIFVDRTSGEYLLIFVKGQARVGLSLMDFDTAFQAFKNSSKLQGEHSE